MAPYAEGTLLQEQGHAEIYLIRDGERLWIPNPYVMDALGLDWNAVQVVPAGSLDAIPRDTTWDPLSGKTPGSVVHVSTKNALDPGGWSGRVYWPLALATTKRHVAWGEDVRTIELRGWMDPPPAPGTGVYQLDPDFSYSLEVDAAWAMAQGIDLSALVKVGNILQLGTVMETEITDPRAWCSVPKIHMEIAGFPPKNQRDRKLPPDWFVPAPAEWSVPPSKNLLDASDGGAANGQPIRWPFNPEKPPPNNTPIAGGTYVRVFGAIVSDKAHYAVKNITAKDAAVILWSSGGRDNWPDDQPRWTEIHPPDWIDYVPPPGTPPADWPPPAQVFRGVTVIAPGTSFGRAAITSTLDVDIMAPAKPHPNSLLQCHEIVSPETTQGSIVDGNPTLDGAAITVLTNPDRVHLHVQVAGSRWNPNYRGKFRALYLLHWETPPPPATVHVPNVEGMGGVAARTAISAAGLAADLQGSPPGWYVTGQLPTAGTPVNRGSTVTLFLEAGGPPGHGRVRQ